MERIDHSTLSSLVKAGAVNSAHIVGETGGWSLQVKCGVTEHLLAAQRSGKTRLFRKFETLVAYLSDLGIYQFYVNALNYNASTTTHRPDRSHALKQTHEAAAYDTWFRTQVEASINDTRRSIPNEEARTIFASKKAALLQRVKA